MLARIIAARGMASRGFAFGVRAWAGARAGARVWKRREFPTPNGIAADDGVGGDDCADCLRYLVATKARVVMQSKLRGL